MTAQSENAPTADAAQQPAPGRWRRRFAIAGLACVALGLLGAGGTLGWLLRGWLPSGGVGVTTYVVKRPVTIEDSGAFRGSLPNVLGLPANEARQAYADAGVDPSLLTLREVPYVAQPGTVVEQQPVAAVKVTKSLEHAELLIAKPATMPDLIGVDGDQARQRLADIGVGATTTVRYDASVDAGAVAATSPAAGARVGPHASLIVSEAPSSVDLADLGDSTGDCSIADAEVDGSTVSDAFVCSLFGAIAHATYPINARVSGFEATLAIADGAPSGASARVVVREDGAVVGSFDASATPSDVRLELHGGKELTLGVQPLGSRDDNFDVVLADARIVGSRSGIDALVAAATP